MTEPPYLDRRAAGRRLAESLHGVVPPGAVAVGLARGGVPVAAEVAQSLAIELDAIAVRKIGHPLQPEYALGAIAPGGPPLILHRDGVADADIARAADRAGREAQALNARLHVHRPPVDIRGRVCVLVDDGLATGASMHAAIHWARAAGASRVIVAVPVGAADTVSALGAEADVVVCPATPRPFRAVGAWYGDFGPVDEAEVVRLLGPGGA